MVSRLCFPPLGLSDWMYRFSLPYDPPVFLLARLVALVGVPLVAMRLSVACRLVDDPCLSAVVALPQRWPLHCLSRFPDLCSSLSVHLVWLTLELFFPLGVERFPVDADCSPIDVDYSLTVVERSLTVVEYSPADVA